MNIKSKSYKGCKYFRKGKCTIQCTLSNNSCCFFCSKLGDCIKNNFVICKRMLDRIKSKMDIMVLLNEVKQNIRKRKRKRKRRNRNG